MWQLAPIKMLEHRSGKTPVHKSLTNLVNQQKTIRKPCWSASFPCPTLSWSTSSTSTNLALTSINQSSGLFSTCAGGKVSVWVLPTAELFGRLRAVWHMHIECTNSYGSNLPVLERLAHAVLKYLDWTWQYSIMRQRELAAILYFCDLCTRKVQVNNNKLESKRKKEKHSSIQLFWKECFIELTNGKLWRRRLRRCFIGSIAYG